MGKKIPKLEDVERAAIARALEEADTRVEAAEALGIGRSTLYRKLDRYGMKVNFGLGGPPLPEGVDGLLAEALEKQEGDAAAECPKESNEGR